MKRVILFIFTLFIILLTSNPKTHATDGIKVANPFAAGDNLSVDDLYSPFQRSFLNGDWKRITEINGINGVKVGDRIWGNNESGIVSEIRPDGTIHTDNPRFNAYYSTVRDGFRGDVVWVNGYGQEAPVPKYKEVTQHDGTSTVASHSQPYLDWYVGLGSGTNLPVQVGDTVLVGQTTFDERREGIPPYDIARVSKISRSGNIFFHGLDWSPLRSKQYGDSGIHLLLGEVSSLTGIADVGKDFRAKGNFRGVTVPEGKVEKIFLTSSFKSGALTPQLFLGVTIVYKDKNGKSQFFNISESREYNLRAAIASTPKKNYTRYEPSSQVAATLVPKPSKTSSKSEGGSVAKTKKPASESSYRSLKWGGGSLLTAGVVAGASYAYYRHEKNKDPKSPQRSASKSAR